MQGNDFVFKVPVPKVKRKWPNLYCRETLSDLDEIWESSCENGKESRSKPATRKVPTRRSLKFDSSKVVHKTPGSSHTDEVLWSSDITETIKSTTSAGITHRPDFSPEEDCLIIIDEETDNWFQPSQSKYTMGLLNELNLSPPDFSSVEEISESCENDNISKTVSPPQENLQHCNSQTGDFQKDTVFQQGRTCLPQDQDEELVSPQSPNVLIIQDESIINADSSESDLDWESLTPPASRSPRDHTVPDIDDVNTFHPPSEFLFICYSPFLSATNVNYHNVPEEQDSFDTEFSHQLPHFAFDQVCPEFYS